jgi:hypothetical protein
MSAISGHRLTPQGYWGWALNLFNKPITAQAQRWAIATLFDKSFPSGEETLQTGFITPFIANHVAQNPWILTLAVFPHLPRHCVHAGAGACSMKRLALCRCAPHRING